MRTYQRGDYHIEIKRKQLKLNLMDPFTAVRQDNLLPHQAMHLVNRPGGAE